MWFCGVCVGKTPAWQCVKFQRADLTIETQWVMNKHKVVWGVSAGQMHRREKALLPVKCEGVKRRLSCLCRVSVKASEGAPAGERVEARKFWNICTSYSRKSVAIISIITKLPASSNSTTLYTHKPPRNLELRGDYRSPSGCPPSNRSWEMALKI